MSKQTETNKRKPSIPSSEAFPCLTSSSFSTYFDILLKMVVASVALFSIIDEVDTSRANSGNPFCRLGDLLELFGSLIELYKDSFQMFPKSIISSILDSSKLMLDISMEKLEECREWRSTEPMLPPDANVFDIADQQFLKDLIDTIGLDVIGRLRKLCSGRSGNISEGKVEDNRCEDELRIAFFGNGIQKVRRLSRGVEHALEELQQISNEHRFGDR